MGNIEIKGNIDTNGLRSFLTFHDGARYHIETSPLICSPNQWTGFYMISASVMKGLRTIFENSGIYVKAESRFFFFIFLFIYFCKAAIVLARKRKITLDASDVAHNM